MRGRRRQAAAGQGFAALLYGVKRPLKKAAQKILLVAAMFVVTLASWNGFYDKWDFRAGAERYGFDVMLEGTAESPFVYRRLALDIAKAMAHIMPHSLKNHLKKYATKRTRHQVEYFIVYGLCIVIFLAALLILRSILQETVHDNLAATLAASIFALLFPFFETNGGYYYDFFELFFFFLAAWCALHGKWFAILLISPIASYNKETFLMFLPALYPLLKERIGIKRSAFTLLASMFLSGIVYLILKHIYHGAHYNNISENIHYLLNIKSYFTRFDWTYGIKTGKGFFLPHVLLLVLLVRLSWRLLDTMWRTHVKIALILNVPAVFISGLLVELRNFSCLYMSFAVLLAHYIHSCNSGKADVQKCR